MYCDITNAQNLRQCVKFEFLMLTWNMYWPCDSTFSNLTKQNVPPTFLASYLHIPS